MIPDMINAKFGINITPEEWRSFGSKILHTEHEFNLATGFTNKDDRLPEFFEDEPLPPYNAIWDFTGEEIDTFWDF
jgi:aldehyde:ferredoxin oxidoreductase